MTLTLIIGDDFGGLGMNSAPFHSICENRFEDFMALANDFSKTDSFRTSGVLRDRATLGLSSPLPDENPSRIRMTPMRQLVCLM